MFLSEIASEQQLAEILAKEAGGLSLPYAWQFDWRKGHDDLHALLKAENKTHQFAVELKLRPNATVIDQLKAKRTKNGPLPLLATVKLSKDLVRRCQEEDISCLDCNGRAWIHSPGLLIDRDLGSKKYRLSLPEPDVFSHKSQRLARTLLATPENQKWTQPELSNRTELSAGLVSRLLNEMELRGWVSGRGKRGQWSLTDANALLDAWAAADKWRNRVVVHQYTSLKPKEAIAGHLTRQFAHAFPIAFTQWLAAEVRHPYASVPVVSAYCGRLPTQEEAEEAGIREVPDGGVIWLITPKDKGVFLETRHLNGINLVSDAQIYLDLLQVGLRGPDQAKALRQWEGFRK